MKVTRLTTAWAVLALAGLSANSQAAENKAGFSMLVGDSFKVSGFGTVLTGQVSSGTLSVGDTVCVPLKSGDKLRRKVNGIESFNKLLKKASKGDNVGLLVADVDHKQVKHQGLLSNDCK